MKTFIKVVLVILVGIIYFECFRESVNPSKFFEVEGRNGEREIICIEPINL